MATWLTGKYPARITGWLTVAAHVVVKSGIAFVAILLECTCCTRVVVTTWMVAMGPTVAAHAPCFFHGFFPLLPPILPLPMPPPLPLLPSQLFSLLAFLCEPGHGVPQQLQLHCHFIGFLLCSVANVGGNLVLLVIFGNRCCRDGGNLVPKFVSFVGFGGLIGTFVFAFSRSAAAILLVDFEVLNESFEVLLGLCPAGFGGLGLVLPGCYLCLIKLVARVHLLQIDWSLSLLEMLMPMHSNANLFIIKIFSKGGEVYVTIPFGLILDLDDLLGMHIKWASSCVQMLQDLNGLHIFVGGVEVLKL